MEEISENNRVIENPSLHSDDPEVRKLARQQRVKRRHDAAKR